MQTSIADMPEKVIPVPLATIELMLSEMEHL
jgi:hypothetical protein